MQTGGHNDTYRAEMSGVRISLMMTKLVVAVRELDGELAARLELTEASGLLVAWTKPMGAAERAGILFRDVILEINYIMTHTLDDFIKAFASPRIGSPNRFLLKRDGTPGFVECWLDDMNQQFDKPIRHATMPMMGGNRK